MHTVRLAMSDCSFEARPGETVLIAALRAGVGLQHECSTGTCGACRVKLLSGAVEQLWPDCPTWTETDKLRGRILACQSVATSDCVIGGTDQPSYRPDIGVESRAGQIGSIEWLTHDMARVVVRTTEPAAFLPGQFAVLARTDGARRAYSMMNMPNDEGVWAFAVKVRPSGNVSRWLTSDKAIGQQVQIDGPLGSAWFSPSEKDVICVAGGSGIGPMLSIAKGFAADPARGRLQFLVGARTAKDLADGKLIETIRAIDTRISVLASLSDATSHPGDFVQGPIHLRLAEAVGSNVAAHDIYLAGPSAMIDATLMTLAHLDCPSENIRFDRFY